MFSSSLGAGYTFKSDSVDYTTWKPEHHLTDFREMFPFACNGHFFITLYFFKTQTYTMQRIGIILNKVDIMSY